jgi:multidrug transporter EmrE-like cation transporter
MNNYLILSTIIAILPIIFIKRYINTNQIYNLFFALILYILLLLSYIKLFEKSDISSTYTILQILQIFLILFVGILFFKESITMNKIFGVLLGSLSIYFLLKN